jgi:hypothetical protein
MVIFTIANIANRDQLSTYLSQVTGNLASTGLIMAKQYFDPGPTQGEVSRWTRYIIYATRVSCQRLTLNASIYYHT